MAALKYSRQREAIKSYLLGRTDHPTADMIYQGLREEFPNISLGTVYRNLSLLTELGEIIKVSTDGPDRFDGRLEPHYHFVCHKCGSVVDMMVSLEDPAIEASRVWKDGIIEKCSMEFYGICRSCM